jgi:hypothetical protein
MLDVKPLALFGLSVLLGTFLLWDGTTNALHPIDLTLGRVTPACYTVLEDLVGVSRPGIIRTAELLGGLALMGYALSGVGRLLRRLARRTPA